MESKISMDCLSFGLVRVALLFATLLALVSPVNASPALSWLEVQQQSDGSVQTEDTIGTAFQSTFEALITKEQVSEELAIDTNAAKAYLFNESFLSTEHLAKKILTGIGSNEQNEMFLAILLARKNPDGGYGSLDDYSSSSLDTAYVLQAIHKLGYLDTLYASQAVDYLISTQGNDGSWALSGNHGSVFLTAVVADALNDVRHAFAATKNSVVSARNYLFSRKLDNGMWQEAYSSGIVLDVLAPMLADVSVLSDTETALTALQSDSGSWDNDAYSTSIIARSLDFINSRQSSATGAGIVSGTVLDSRTGTPLSNAVISVLEIPGWKVKSNIEGYFSLSGLAPGEYTIVAKKLGFSAYSRIASIQYGEILSVGKIALEMEPGYGLLSGRIVDIANQAPISQVEVTLNGSETYHAFTASNGFFELSGVAEGEYQLNIEKVGYNSMAGSLTVESGKVLTINQSLSLVGAYADDSPGMLSGTVVDAASSGPVQGILFSLDSGLSVETDEFGVFVLDNVERGSYNASLSGAGYRERNFSIQYPAGASGQMGELKIYSADDDDNYPDVTLHGIVKDGVSAAPIANASVRIMGQALNTVTDTVGAFVLEKIPEKVFQVEITAPGYGVQTFDVSAASFGETSVTFNISLSQEGYSATAISGTVVDAETGVLIPDAHINVVGVSGYSAVTDADGQFTLDGIEQLNFEITVVAQGYKTEVRPIQLSTPGNYTVAFSLSPVEQSIFEVVSVDVESPEWGANTTANFTAEVRNLTETSKDALIVAELYDAEGESVDKVYPYLTGTEIIDPNVSFTAHEVKTLSFPWKTGQRAVGTYQIIVRVVNEEEQYDSDAVVFAEGGAFITLVETRAFDGALSISPPLTQAGAETPVAITALLRNAGNTYAEPQAYQLEIADPETGEVLHQATVDALAMEVGQRSAIDFGAWNPEAVGNLQVRIAAVDNEVGGELNGVLYVGDVATGQFDVAPSIVKQGTQTVHGNILLKGVDTLTATSVDPLYQVVKDAVERGGDYVSSETLAWSRRHRCLGCHVQPQALFGLAESFDKADVDRDAAQHFYNSITSSQFNNGSVRAVRASSRVTQSFLALWGLTSWPDKVESFRTKLRLAEYLHSEKEGDRWYSDGDNSSWWGDVDASTSLVVIGMSDVLSSAEKLDSENDLGYRIDKVANVTQVDDTVADLAVADDGFIYYTHSTGEIVRLNLESGEQTLFAENISDGLRGIVISENGDFFLTSINGELFRLRDGVQETLYYSDCDRLHDLDIGADGLIYVSTRPKQDEDKNFICETEYTGSVKVFTQQGELINTINSPLFSYPHGLVVDNNNNVFIANEGGYNFLMIDPEGSVNIFASGFLCKTTLVGDR